MRVAILRTGIAAAAISSFALTSYGSAHSAKQGSYGGYQFDSKFCPADPSPWRSMMTLGVLTNGNASKGKNIDIALSAQSAMRIVDVRRNNRGIGWLYLDQYGDRFVLLKKSADDEDYEKFRMHRDPLLNHYAPDPMTYEIEWPRAFELLSCNKDAG